MHPNCLNDTKLCRLAAPFHETSGWVAMFLFSQYVHLTNKIGLPLYVLWCCHSLVVLGPIGRRVVVEYSTVLIVLLKLDYILEIKIEIVYVNENFRLKFVVKAAVALCESIWGCK